VDEGRENHSTVGIGFSVIGAAIAGGAYTMMRAGQFSQKYEEYQRERQRLDESMTASRDS